MKKRKIALKSMSVFLSMMAVVLVMPLLQATAATKIGDYKCIVNQREKTVIVMEYAGSATELTLPEEIDGYKVDCYEDFVYGRCKTLQKVTIPGSMKTIPEGLFDSCSSLKEVVINEGVESIGRQAFGECSVLEKVYFPKSLKSIGERAFSGCKALKGRILLENTESIGGRAFFRCDGIEKLYIERDVNIGSEAFWDCKSLKYVAVSGNVSGIGSDAFYGCKSLKYVAVFGNVSDIGSKAFFGCKSLENVAITGKIGSIGDTAFLGCDVLKNIMSEGIGNIGYVAIPKSVSLGNFGNSAVSSAFGSGNTVLLLGGGFLAGAIVTALIITVTKKRKNKIQAQSAQ